MSTSTIGSLAVNVVANTAGFASGMAKARAELKLFSAGVNAVKGTMTGLGAGLVAGFTIHGLKSTAEEMDKITKHAAKLGLSTEALSALDFAAGRSNASFESLAKALQMMERNLGSGAAAQYLKDLGLNIENVRRLSPDRAFLVIADKIKGLGDEARRTNDIMGIFGRGGADIGNLLLEGADGIQSLMDRARELGLAFDEQMGQKAEAANDALLDLQSAVKGLARELVVTLGPALTSALTGLADLIAKKDLIKTVGADELQGNFFDTMLGDMSDADFQKFYQQYGNASKQKGGISSLLIGEYGLTPDKVNVDELDSAITRRFDKITAGIQQRQEDQGLTTGIGQGGSMFALPTLLGMNFGMAAMQKYPGMFHSPENDPAEDARIIAAVNESMLLNQTPTPAPAGGFLPAAFGAFGQEAGTAEAFRQERRTALAGAGDIPGKQLAEAKAQTKALAKIDKNTADIQKLEVINIA